MLLCNDRDQVIDTHTNISKVFKVIIKQKKKFLQNLDILLFLSLKFEIVTNIQYTFMFTDTGIFFIKSIRELHQTF